MHSQIFNPQPTRPLDGQQYLVLHMPARTFSGLVVRRIILPYCLHPTYGTTGICSLLYFMIQDVLQTPWHFGEKLDKYATVLRGLLLVLTILRFLEESPKLLAKFLIVLWCFPKRGCRDIGKLFELFWTFRSFLGVSDLVAGLFDHHTHVWKRFLRDICPLCSLDISGFFQSSWKYCSTIVRDVPGSLHCSFCFPHLMIEKVLEIYSDIKD